MNYLGIIITLVLLMWVWIWIFNQVFSQLKTNIKWKSLLWGAVLVILLFVYEWLFGVLGIDKESFYLRDVFNFPSVTLFLIYGLLVLILITLLFRNMKNKKLLYEIGVAIISLIILSLFGWCFGLTVLVLYYLLAAFTEEMFKFTVSNNQSEKLGNNKISLLLFLSVLIGLSFSISENILAFISQFISGDLSVGFILGRGLVASMIHCVSTGVIALLLMKIKKGGIILKYFIALLLGSSIHICYNLAVVNNITWIVFLLVIFSLVALSYLFFNMDEIYCK